MLLPPSSPFLAEIAVVVHPLQATDVSTILTMVNLARNLFHMSSYCKKIMYFITFIAIYTYYRYRGLYTFQLNSYIILQSIEAHSLLHVRV